MREKIEYIFSDKTGTLTCNMMEFRECSIAGLAYAEKVDPNKKAKVVDGELTGQLDFKQLLENEKTHASAEVITEFLTLLSTCHTVIPERGDNDRIFTLKHRFFT